MVVTYNSRLWSGLMDFGYRPSEISTMLRLEHKMCQATGSTGKEVGGLEQDVLNAEGGGGGSASESQDGIEKFDSFRAKPGSGASAVRMLSDDTKPATDSEECEAKQDGARSAEAEAANGSEEGNDRFLDSASEKSPTRSWEEEEEANGRVLEVKKFFPIVSIDEFRVGVQEAVGKMSETRRQRFAANIDMMGEAPEEQPERVFNDSTATDVDGDTKNGVNTDFAVQAARRAKLQVFSKQLPPFLIHLKKKVFVCLRVCVCVCVCVCVNVYYTTCRPTI